MKRILVVDDSRTVRTILRQMLKPRGFVVEEAEDGVKALAICRKQAPDAILLDVNMPEMDGLACLREVRGDPALASCVVVMCTTQVEFEQIAAAIEAGANEYIMKPFTEEILMDKLKQVGVVE
jgi:two-component system chemotaxis response regulator CheY